MLDKMAEAGPTRREHGIPKKTETSGPLDGRIRKISNVEESKKEIKSRRKAPLAVLPKLPL